MTQHVTETATRESCPQENGAGTDGSGFTWPCWLPKVRYDDELWMWHLAMRWMENDFAVVLTKHQIAVVNGYIAGLPPEPRHEVLGGINYELSQLQRPPDWPYPFRFRVFLKQVVEFNTTSHDQRKPSTPPLRSDDDDDPIEECLSGQLLTLYRYLKCRSRRTPFDTLATLKCWRVDDPSDDAILGALKRLQRELNKVSLSLVIESKDRRTYLDK